VTETRVFAGIEVTTPSSFDEVAPALVGVYDVLLGDRPAAPLAGDDDESPEPGRDLDEAVPER
jgi:hypothetical protein